MRIHNGSFFVDEKKKNYYNRKKSFAKAENKYERRKVMKINTLFDKKDPVFSLEIFPPKKTSAIEGLYRTLEGLAGIHPDFISVTYGAGGGNAGMQTCELAAHIKNNLHIEPLAHMTCVNADKTEIEERLSLLKKNGIENVLALRGDILEDSKLAEDLSHASDLASLIREKKEFNIVGACYPEGHYESENLDIDIENLHYKIDAGVTHLITQLFFDNSKFYHFREKLDQSGIHIPVEAGIMPIVTTRQLERTVALSGASLPVEFTHMVSRYSNNPEALFHAGVAYAIEQIYELLENGVQGIHLYTMNNAKVAQAVYEGIKTELGH